MGGVKVKKLNTHNTARTAVDAITAEDIGVFSDNNIGEALSRVPGIALVRTTLNGRTVLSSLGCENGRVSRSFSFNIIPSEVINKAQVY